MNHAIIHKKIKKILQDNLFNIIDDKLTKEKFIVISNFGEDINEATFYIDKKNEIDAIVIGAHINLDKKIVTKKLLSNISLISTTFDISCSPLKYDSKNTASISLKTVYSFVQYDEDLFLKYINNFKSCVKRIHNDIYNYVYQHELFYIDLSMFEGKTDFDPYPFIITRDRDYNGSWQKYINSCDDENLNQIEGAKLCKRFEEVNGIAIDLVCDYIINTIGMKRGFNN